MKMGLGSGLPYDCIEIKSEIEFELYWPEREGCDYLEIRLEHDEPEEWNCDDGSCANCPYCTEFYKDAPEKRPHCGLCRCEGCYKYDRVAIGRGPREKALEVLKIHYPNMPELWRWWNE